MDDNNRQTTTYGCLRLLPMASSITSIPGPETLPGPSQLRPSVGGRQHKQQMYSSNNNNKTQKITHLPPLLSLRPPVRTITAMVKFLSHPPFHSFPRSRMSDAPCSYFLIETIVRVLVFHCGNMIGLIDKSIALCNPHFLWTRSSFLFFMFFVYRNLVSCTLVQHRHGWLV